MRTANLVAAALAAEQKRLLTLPHIGLDDDEVHDFYGGRLYLVECDGSLQDGTIGTRGFGARQRSVLSCGRCGLIFGSVGDGVVPMHGRPLHGYEQAQDTVEVLIAVLGLDAWSPALANATSSARGSRADTHAGRVAEALPHLAAALVRQDATAGVQKGLTELAEFTPHSGEHPLFTESGLYDLIGKDDARTVLYTLAAVQRAAGWSAAPDTDVDDLEADGDDAATEK